MKNIITANDCPLFKGLSESEIEYSEKRFCISEKNYAKGEILKHAGVPICFFGFLLTGSILVYIYDIDGNKIIMSDLCPGDSFAESMCYLKQTNDVVIECISDATVLQMKISDFENPLNPENEIDKKLSNNFISMLAQRTLAMNQRIQILSKPMLRDKIITFLSFQKSEGGKITVSMNREDMAMYLGVNRSALSRELSKMKSDGLLDFNKNYFYIL